MKKEMDGEGNERKREKGKKGDISQKNRLFVFFFYSMTFYVSFTFATRAFD